MIIIIIFYIFMFLGNTELLQKNLHSDLNTLIKNVKIREDQHLTLLQYNKALIQKLSEMDSIPFFQEELARHRSFLDSIKNQHNTIKQQEEEMSEKYCSTSSMDSNTMKLLGRVVARVIEILQGSLQKCKLLDRTIQQNFLILKDKLLECTKDKTQIEIDVILETIIRYVELKSQKQIERLAKIIEMMNDGDFTRLSSIYQTHEQKKKDPPLLTTNTLVHKKETSPKKVSPVRSKPKLNKSREQIDDKKKEKTKLATRMLTTFYQTMDLSKQQFMQDMVFTNPESKKIQIYSDIFARNKANKTQILGFESEKERFQKKVDNFKVQMQKESYKIQEILNFVKLKPITDKPDSPQKQTEKTEDIETPKSRNHKSEKKQQSIPYYQLISPERQRSFRKRQKASIEKFHQQKQTNQALYSSIRSSQQFQHLKLNVSEKKEQPYRNNRSRLPNISGRFSMDMNTKNKEVKRPQFLNKLVKKVEVSNVDSYFEPFYENNKSQNKIESDLEWSFSPRRPAYKFTHLKNQVNH